jgi:hypothetical protein
MGPVMVMFREGVLRGVARKKDFGGRGLVSRRTWAKRKKSP